MNEPATRGQVQRIKKQLTRNVRCCLPVVREDALALLARIQADEDLLAEALPALGREIGVECQSTAAPETRTWLAAIQERLGETD